MKEIRTIFEEAACVRCQVNTSHHIIEYDGGQRLVKCFRCEEYDFTDPRKEEALRPSI